MKRCEWVEGKPEFYLDYHDRVWGKACHDDQDLFKWLVLETFSTGLSWQIILSKKAAFEEAFDSFDVLTVSEYQEEKIAELMANSAIVRHRGKIEASIQNAKAFLAIQEEFGQFDTYIWSFTDQKIRIRQSTERLTQSDLSDNITADLKKRGFKWVGSVTIYSYLQAIGVINDHDLDCSFK